ncbi:hypothetical protein [Okeania sp. KiyG1]|nr:hypothetical protein [Okeania sp. KiyG1]
MSLTKIGYLVSRREARNSHLTGRMGEQNCPRQSRNGSWIGDDA